MLSDPTATQHYTKAPIANFYFTAVDGLFRCRCGAIPRQTSRTGYSTLMQHVRSQHPDFADVMSVVDDGRGNAADVGLLAQAGRVRLVRLDFGQ
ncbi:hypothetical protein F442_23159 [Phytophthora nicotianae P10297]|uniref:BED-type domain-containing protein n=1 Tax=Phytophthora nicotianae P10297 TaxID=1317064 RepID=W2Y047_PHYNI|nr:hypothetical protein F442_23159 [Phytophthora nicotianae P10297]